MGHSLLARFALGMVLVTSAGSAGTARPSTPGKIPVGPQSHICTVMMVDAAVLRDELLSRHMEWDGIFARQVRRVFDDRWQNLPFTPIEEDEGRIHRYATADGGPNPYCSRPGTDIFITLSYSPRANGRPYLVKYSVSRGRQTRSGTFDVDLAAELKSGRVARLTERRDISEIVLDDMDVRIKSLVGMLELARR